MDSASRSRRAGLGSLLAVLVLLALAAPPAPAGDGLPVPDVDVLVDAQVLTFVPNLGQWPDEVLFRAGAGPQTTWFTREGFTTTLEELRGDPDTGAARAVAGVAVRFAFEGAGPDGEGFGGAAVGEQPTGAVQHFLRGDDPSRWVTHVPVFRRLRYADLYPGVDLVARAAGGRLAYDLEVEPGGDLGSVSFRAEGAQSSHVDASGALVLGTPLGPLRQSPPVSWYRQPTGARLRAEVDFQLDAAGDRWGFTAPDGPEDLELVVDPELSWASYLGGTSFDYVLDLELAPDGDVVVAGFTHGSGFPTTVGAYDVTLAGSRDAYVARFAADGSGLLFSTLLGGNGEEEIRAMALLDDGQIAVGGFTSSADFPVPGGFDTAQAGGQGVLDSDAFVARLSADGSTLGFGSYLGGFGDDIVEALAVDTDGAIVVGGRTASSNFPTPGGGYDGSYGGGTDDGGDAFLARVSAAGSLEWATFLGAESDELINDLVLEPDGAITATGWTQSAFFPTTAGVFDDSRNGFSDAWVARLPATGSSLVFSTFLGGGADDNGTAIDRFEDGSLLVGGTTLSNDFPVTPTAFDDSFAGGGFFGDAWLVHLAADGTVLEFGTYLGGAQDEFPTSVHVDGDGTAVLCGWSSSPETPVTSDAPQAILNGTGDAYAARLDVTGGVLLVATFLGGNKLDKAFAGDLGPDGRVVLGGMANSADFPVTGGAFDQTFSGFPGLIGDAFVADLDLAIPDGAGGNAWIDLGSGLPGDAPSAPGLVGVGQVAVGASGSLDIVGGPANRPGVLYVGVEAAPTDHKGGTLVPLPVDLLLLFTTSPAGGTSFAYGWPETTPSGFQVYLQAWISDPAGPEGWSASNALYGEVP